MNATAWLNNGETYVLRGKTQKKRQSYRNDFFRRGGYVLNSRRKPLPRAPAAIGVDVTDIISGSMARFQCTLNHNSHFQQLEDDDESHTVERVREREEERDDYPWNWTHSQINTSHVSITRPTTQRRTHTQKPVKMALKWSVTVFFGRSRLPPHHHPATNELI